MSASGAGLPYTREQVDLPCSERLRAKKLLAFGPQPLGDLGHPARDRSLLDFPFAGRIED
jgi:hypothetical protein